MEITPKIEFLGLTFDVTVMIGTVITCALVFLLLMLATRGQGMIPKGLQNLMEMVLEFVSNITNMMLDRKKAETYLGFALTIFLFVLISNLSGVIIMIAAEAHEPIPWLGITEEALQVSHEVSWFKSPTSNINVTVAMAFAIAIYAHFAGIFKDPKSYFTHYFKPFWWMFPLHIIDELAKPTTHAARLWANIFAGEVLIIILSTGLWYMTALPLIVWLGFSIFVGIIQAYIFTVLAMVYISQKVAEDH